MINNMYTMLRAENSISSAEKHYSRWLNEVRKVVSFEVDENGLAFDLYADSCSPEEAAEEIMAVHHG